jgi:hypothetical protein
MLAVVPRLVRKGAMHAMANESKTMSFRTDQVPPSISSGGASIREVFLKLLFFGVVQRWRRVFVA